MEKRLCIRCGNQGHTVGDCKFLPARPPLSTNKASANGYTKIDPTLALPEEEAQEEEVQEEVGSDDSGKE